MTMVQIAEAVGVHETTVSRAISGKYISTPQGVFEMRYFFTPGYQTATGESMSNTSVKEAILDLIKSESATQPAQRQGYRFHPERARHPHRPAHGGQVPQRVEHPAEQHAQAVLSAVCARRRIFAGCNVGARLTSVTQPK